MTGLGREAHRLLELARGGDDPSNAQLLSLHGAVAARIAAEGALTASGTTATAKVASASAYVKGLVAAAALATGAAGLFALQSRDPETTATPVAHSAERAAPLPERPKAPEPAAAPSPAPADTSPPPVRAVKPSPGLRLQEEAALLAEVQGALRSGRAGAALGKLESYDRRFPAGMLRAEADAARVFALCSAGRVDKARASAARFVQRYPSSPAAARVQAACK
jgi:hypothetical protein